MLNPGRSISPFVARRGDGALPAGQQLPEEGGPAYEEKMVGVVEDWGQIAIQTQREVERIGREITEHRAQTNAEIHNDMFLTLMEQEEYVNPCTNEVETGSNQWKYRWVNESDEVIYPDREAYGRRGA